MGYLWGRGYDVEITSVLDSSGKLAVFGVGIAELEATQSERPLSLNDLLQAVFKSEHLRRALGDLREAVRSSLDTGFFCCRAVESLMQGFVRPEDGDDRARAWERLRNALHVDEKYIKEVKKFGDPQRHGRTPYMSGEDRVAAMKRAWKVVDRFCAYVHRGFTPLSPSEFGELGGN